MGRRESKGRRHYVSLQKPQSTANSLGECHLRKLVRRNVKQKESRNNEICLEQERHCDRNAAHPPPRQTRHTRPHSPRFTTAFGCICAANHAGRPPPYSSHRLGPSPLPAAPTPPPRRQRQVSAAHRARSGRALATASSWGAPPTGAQQMTSMKTPAAPKHPPRPRRAEAALGAARKGRADEGAGDAGALPERRPLCV